MKNAVRTRFTWTHVAVEAVRRFEWGEGFASIGRWLAKEARRRIESERRKKAR